MRRAASLLKVGATPMTAQGCRPPGVARRRSRCDCCVECGTTRKCADGKSPPALPKMLDLLEVDQQNWTGWTQTAAGVIEVRRRTGRPQDDRSQSERGLGHHHGCGALSFAAAAWTERQLVRQLNFDWLISTSVLPGQARQRRQFSSQAFGMRATN